MPSHSRSWVFTINNPIPEDERRLESLTCRYVVYGREKGAKGTPHLQGFVMFKSACTREALSKKIPHAYLAASVAPTAAAKYAKKDGDFVERGDPPKDEKRNMNADAKAAHAIELARAGRMDEIIQLYPSLYLQRKRTFESIMARTYAPEELTDVAVYWIYGAPGCGKSRAVIDSIDPQYLYKKGMNKWWDHYDPLRHEYVLMDDVDHRWSVLSHLLKHWLHNHTIFAEMKGGSMTIRPRVVFITSNYSLADCFMQEPGNPSRGIDIVTLNALDRRIKARHVTKFECSDLPLLWLSKIEAAHIRTKFPKRTSDAKNPAVSYAPRDDQDPIEG